MKRYDIRGGYIVRILFIGMIFISSCSQKPTIRQDNSKYLVNETNAELGGLEQINTEALEHIMDGQLYLDQGDFAMAIVELQEAQRLEPNVSSIYISLAECYWNLNKPERSMEYLETAIEIEPDNFTTREVMAEQLFRLQDFPKSEEQYKILL
ncbi:MAG: tetratricopeptide repeat protein, partial [Candidatus Marinimicrobia bacterium]|nr:tetratricopeptide repeat protein [Candidatus Neomarinimicrobiota bacterium]